MAKLSTELQHYFLGEPQGLTAHETAAAEVATPGDEVTLEEILALAGERTFGFLFVLLSLPSALPIPAPGYSIPFGIVMALLAIQLLQGSEQPWLPEKWRKRGFERQKVKGLIQAGLPWLRRIEAISRPRLTGICTSRVGRLVMGIAILLMSICMMIPIPGTNTLPAIGIFVTGFGLLDDDGAISLAGLTICIMALGLVSSIFILGAEVVDRGKEAVKGLFLNF
jgi:hypothetical protein